LLRLYRRAYQWTIQLAEKKSGEQALWGLSFAEASFFPIPPDPLLLVLGAAQPQRALRFALGTTVFSVLGGLLGWIIGAYAMELFGNAIVAFYGLEEAWLDVEVKYAEHGWKVLFVAALTPIPFKVFTIAGGAFAQSLPGFILASFLGRGLRFGLEGMLLRIWGAPILNFIERWFDKLAILFTLLVIGGFVLLGSV